MKTKLYCYADETGQDTLGMFFLVAVVVVDDKNHQSLQDALEEIEFKTGKAKLKWKSTSRQKRKLYTQQISRISELEGRMFYATYKNSKKYLTMTSKAIASAITYINLENHSAIVVIDALKKGEQYHVGKILKSHRTKYHKIRGMNNEQSAFLRLADALAGFMRDKLEGAPYTKAIKKPGCLDLVTQHCEEVG